MTPSQAIARVIASVIMVAAMVAAIIEARPAWVALGATAAAVFLATA